MKNDVVNEVGYVREVVQMQYFFDYYNLFDIHDFPTL